MKRLRLDSIALTIGLTIVLSMGLGFTLQRLVNVGMGRAGLFSGRNPGRFDLRFYYFLFPARVVSLSEALDAVSADQRLGMIAAAQRRYTRVELRDAPVPGVVNSRERFPTVIRRRIKWLSPVYHPLITALKTPAIALQKTAVVDPRYGSRRMIGHRLLPRMMTTGCFSKPSCGTGIGWCSRQVFRRRETIRRRPSSSGHRSAESSLSRPF